MPPNDELVAIVGRGCIVPGAANADQLWTLATSGKVALRPGTSRDFALDPSVFVGGTPSERERCKAWHAVAGFVEPPDAPRTQDSRLHRWVRACAEQALAEGKLGRAERQRSGIVLGNLTYPTQEFARFAEDVWLHELVPGWSSEWRHAAEERFFSAGAARVAADSLGFRGPTYALDVACASSLYAIQLAADHLRAGEADLMLAGGVNASDSLYLQLGFATLGALSHSGRSLPLHRDADGLVPAQGCAMIALKRLSDALRDGNPILGVLRGIGISNDGRSGSFLAPSQEGQTRALLAAYEQANVSPKDVAFIECHATGTRVGDRVELESLAGVLGQRSGVPLSTFKARIGHTITPSGCVGLIHALNVLEHGLLPPPYLAEVASPIVGDLGFRLPTGPVRLEQPRFAAVSSFGFGGNNAHLIVERFTGVRPSPSRAAKASAPAPLALVGMAVRCSNAGTTLAFADLVTRGVSDTPLPDEIVIPRKLVAFPPNDLAASIAQQIALIPATDEALARTRRPAVERVGVFIGAQCDAEACHVHVARRIRSTLKEHGIPFDEAWCRSIEQVGEHLDTSASVISAMGNVAANRLNSQFDARGSGMVIFADEHSGLVAFDLAARALAERRIDAAIVGAVDLSRELVHQAAHAAIGQTGETADAVVVLVLKRAETAANDGDTIWCLMDPVLRQDAEREREQREPASPDIGHLVGGRAHAAHGLLNVAAAIARLDAGTPVLSCELDSCFRAPLQVTVRATGAVVREAILAAQTQLEERSSFALKLPLHRPPLGRTMPTLEPTPLPPRRRPQPLRALPSLQAMPGVSSLQALPGLSSLQPTHLSWLDAHHAVTSAHGDYLRLTQRLLCGDFALSFDLEDAHGSSTAPHAPSLIRTRSFPPIRSAPVAVLRSETARAAPPEAPAGPRPATPPPAGSPNLHPVGWDRATLEELASGSVSRVYGQEFAEYDTWQTIVRLPAGKLLLADRIVAIEGVPKSMGKARLWTETDVQGDSWYLHHGRMPAGIFIEAGQADLTAISWLGVDFNNRGRRVYRLLGCRQKFFGELPKPGETLRYEIRILGHAAQGDVRLFFFEYDCWSGSSLRARVRSAQAGFFTPSELAASKGVLWDASSASYSESPRLSPPPLTVAPCALDREGVLRASRGALQEVFGPAFRRVLSHSRTPSIQADAMNMLGDLFLDPKGGPAGRGYLRSTRSIVADEWFFEGHFVADPCMPGTLMAEGCVQAMSLYLMALGYTIERDGWRFEPLTDTEYAFQCRGQVVPTSRELVYEVFVDEIFDTPTPTLFAHVLCTVDGTKAFCCERFAVRLVPDWPVTTLPAPDSPPLDRSAAELDGLRLDAQSIQHCCLGIPSRAFGPKMASRDDGRPTLRLPGDPYLFISRIDEVHGEFGVPTAGSELKATLDVPPSAWYFEDAPGATLPVSVVMEMALQPCGWLANFNLPPESENVRELRFRNLDGTVRISKPIRQGVRAVQMHARLHSISGLGNLRIDQYDVQLVADGVTVLDMRAAFGFFPEAALRAQKGLPLEAADAAVLRFFDEPPAAGGAVSLDLRGSARLHMLDQIRWLALDGGRAGLGMIVGEKRVVAGDWFFRCHFYQDPVQPGSLGVEGLSQLLAVLAREKGLIARDAPYVAACVEWHYRGQVVPENVRVLSSVELTSVEEILSRDGRRCGVLLRGHGLLFCDSLKIYQTPGLRIFVPDEGCSIDNAQLDEAIPWL